MNTSHPQPSRARFFSARGNPIVRLGSNFFARSALKLEDAPLSTVAIYAFVGVVAALAIALLAIGVFFGFLLPKWIREQRTALADRRAHRADRTPSAPNATKTV